MIDVDALDDEEKGMRRSGRQKDERAAVESAASKRATRQVCEYSIIILYFSFLLTILLSSLIILPFS